MAQAVFYDPEDPRRGVLADAFAAVQDDPEDDSWTSWLPPVGSDPGKRVRAEAARQQWLSQVRSHDWRRKDTLTVAAIYSAANFGIRDDFMRALEARVGPTLTRSVYVTADRGWVDSAAAAAVTTRRWTPSFLATPLGMKELLDGEAVILDGIEHIETTKGTAKETAIGVGVALGVLGAVWLGTR